MPKLEGNGMLDRVPGRAIRPVPDSAGVKPGNGGGWIRVEWKVKRALFRMHIPADLDTWRIPDFGPTDVKGGDAAQLPGLPRGAPGRCVGRGVFLPEPVAGMALNAASAEGRKTD